MFYYLSQFGELLRGIPAAKGLNVFQYISFRALCAGLTSFVFCLVFGNTVIRRLISLKLGQPIRSAEEVHRLNEWKKGQSATTTSEAGVTVGSKSSKSMESSDFSG